MNRFIIFLLIFCLFIFSISKVTAPNTQSTEGLEEKKVEAEKITEYKESGEDYGGYLIRSPSSSSSDNDDNDDVYVEFVKGLPPAIDGQKYIPDDKSKDKIVMTSLGIMYLMKQDLECEKIVTEFNQIEKEREAEKEKERETEKKRDTEKEQEKKTDKYRDTDNERETEKERERETDKKRDTDKERETEKERERETLKDKCKKCNSYMNYIYEYLFRVYLEGHYSMLASHLPAAVKPEFTETSAAENGENKEQQITLGEALRALGGIYSFYYDAKASKYFEYNWHPIMANLLLNNGDKLAKLSKDLQNDLAKMPESREKMSEIRNHFDKMLEAMAEETKDLR